MHLDKTVAHREQRGGGATANDCKLSWWWWYNTASATSEMLFCSAPTKVHATSLITIYLPHIPPSPDARRSARGRMLSFLHCRTYSRTRRSWSQDVALVISKGYCLRPRSPSPTNVAGKTAVKCLSSTVLEIPVKSTARRYHLNSSRRDMFQKEHQKRD